MIPIIYLPKEDTYKFVNVLDALIQMSLKGRCDDGGRYDVLQRWFVKSIYSTSTLLTTFYNFW